MKFMIDSSVILSHFKGSTSTKMFLRTSCVNEDSIGLSVLSEYQLEKTFFSVELVPEYIDKIDNFKKLFKILPITSQIARRAAVLQSPTIPLETALLAATALEHGLAIISATPEIYKGLSGNLIVFNVPDSIY